MIFLLKLILILSCFTDGLFSYVCLCATSHEHKMMLDIIQIIIHTHIYINIHTDWCLTALALTYTCTHLMVPDSLASLFPCCMVLIPPPPHTHTLHGALLPKYTLSDVLPHHLPFLQHSHTRVLVTGTYPSDRYLGCFVIWIISSSLSSTSVFLIRHDTTVSIFLEIPSHFCISLTMTCRTRRISLHPLMMS